MIGIRLTRTLEGENPSAAARHLLASALEAEYEIPAAACRVKKDEKGKPYLIGYPNIHISISHSGPYAACAFGENPVGIDIEVWKRHARWRQIMKKMHPQEQAELAGYCGGTITPETEEPVQKFCDLWVRKESFLKAIGEGLRIPLDAFDTTGKIVHQKMRQESYHIRNYQLPGEKLSIAVCAQEELDLNCSVW